MHTIINNNNKKTNPLSQTCFCALCSGDIRVIKNKHGPILSKNERETLNHTN